MKMLLEILQKIQQNTWKFYKNQRKIELLHKMQSNENFVAKNVGET